MKRGSLTSRTPFLGGFQMHLFHGTFVWQLILASSPTAITSCFPSESDFRITRYSSLAEELLHATAFRASSAVCRIAHEIRSVNCILAAPKRE